MRISNKEREKMVDCATIYGLTCSADLCVENGDDELAVEILRAAVTTICKYPDLKNKLIRDFNEEQYDLFKDILER